MRVVHRVSINVSVGCSRQQGVEESHSFREKAVSGVGSSGSQNVKPLV